MPLNNLGNGCYRWGSAGKKYCGAGAKLKAIKQGLAEVKGDSRKFKEELHSAIAEKLLTKEELDEILIEHDPYLYMMENYDSGYSEAYIPKTERDKIPTEDFADPERRKYPITSQKHLDSAVKLLGKAPASRQAAIKARIKKIAKRKNFILPKSWF